MLNRSRESRKGQAMPNPASCKSPRASASATSTPAATAKIETTPASGRSSRGNGSTMKSPPGRFPKVEDEASEINEDGKQMLAAIKVNQTEIKKMLKQTTDEERELERIAKQKKAEKQSAISQFESHRDLLSLDLVKIHDLVELRFRRLILSDPDRKFTIALKLDADRQYVVKDCEGGDREFDSLVAELNRTNDLRRFLVKVRQRYGFLALL